MPFFLRDINDFVTSNSSKFDLLYICPTPLQFRKLHGIKLSMKLSGVYISSFLGFKLKTSFEEVVTFLKAQTAQSNHF